MSAGTDGWVIVSGAGGALGRAIAGHYAASGRKVLALDRDPERLAGQVGVDVRAADLTDEAATDAALEAIDRKDSIALLVNAVGLIWSEPVVSIRGATFAAHSMDNWRRVIDANLSAPFLLASRVAARMVRRGGGAIVNVSSVAASGNAGQAAYSAAKAGIEGLTRAMAAELGPLGVRVNAIAPGFIDTASTAAALDRPVLDAYVARTPVRRLGRTDEIISAIDFLATNQFANGAILPLDGGLRL